MNTGDAIESRDPVESRNPIDSADLIDKQFTDGFNHVHDLFLADRLEECEEAAFALLKEEAIPRYHKMRTLILLGTIVGDWDEANRYHVAAEGMWRIVRRYHPVGDDEGVEKAIAELRELLDELDAALRDDEPSDYDFINTVEDAVEKHDADMEDIAEEDDADVEDARAEMDHLDFNDAAAIPSLNVEAPADEPQSPAKKQPKHLTVDMGNVRDPTRQPPPESPAMMSSNWRAMNAPRSPAFTSTNWRQRQPDQGK